MKEVNKWDEGMNEWSLQVFKTCLSLKIVDLLLAYRGRSHRPKEIPMLKKKQSNIFNF